MSNINDNIRHVARVPIVPDDLIHQDFHKDHELVMDFDNDDICYKKNGGYINITGKIKEEIKQINDGSSVIHIVTEQSVPPVQDRTANNWYYVITRSEEASGTSISTASYIYYGLIKTYHKDTNYILISQNTTTGSDTLKFNILKGYCPCIYVPINYSAVFKDHNTGKSIEYTKEDRIYAMNPSTKTFNMYEVYTLNVYTEGEHLIDIELGGSDHFSIQFDSNVDNIKNINLPSTMSIRDGECIGNINDPEWDDPQYLFMGWSTNQLAETIIDPTKYKPDSNMNLYAWFKKNTDVNVLSYYVTYTS